MAYLACDVTENHTHTETHRERVCVCINSKHEVEGHLVCFSDDLVELVKLGLLSSNGGVSLFHLCRRLVHFKSQRLTLFLYLSTSTSALSQMPFAQKVPLFIHNVPAILTMAGCAMLSIKIML